MWAEALKEQNDWLQSSDFNKAEGLYKCIETKLMQEVPKIRAEKQQVARRRGLLVEEYRRHKRSLQQATTSPSANGDDEKNISQIDYEFSHGAYQGDGHDKVGEVSCLLSPYHLITILV